MFSLQQHIEHSTQRIPIDTVGMLPEYPATIHIGHNKNKKCHPWEVNHFNHRATVAHTANIPWLWVSPYLHGCTWPLCCHSCLSRATV